MNDKEEFLSLYEIESLSPVRPFSYVERPTFVQAPFWCLVHVALLLLVFGTAFRLTPKNFYSVFAVLSLSLVAFATVFARYIHQARSAYDSYRVTNRFIEIASGHLYRETRCIPWFHVQAVSTRVSLFQRLFDTGDIILCLSPAVGSVERGASLTIGSGGSLSHRTTRGESVTLKDVEHVGVKVRLMRELIDAERAVRKE
jgi:membrane protein YdbS with pleckstrin-like domain